MIASTLALSLIGLATASPIATAPHYPSSEVSKGVRLVVNVTDPSHDLSPSVHNTYITSIHVGAGFNLIGNTDDADRSRIFYVNGTDNRHPSGDGLQTISDGGMPSSPYPISLTKDKDNKYVSTGHLNAGRGSDIGIATFPNPYPFLTPETWMACDEPVKYYQDAHFTIFKRAEETYENGQTNHHIPKECVAVRLLAECAQLNELEEGAYSSHEFALDSPCYKSVKSIDWTKV